MSSSDEYHNDNDDAENGVNDQQKFSGPIRNVSDCHLQGTEVVGESFQGKRGQAKTQCLGKPFRVNTSKKLEGYHEAIYYYQVSEKDTVIQQSSSDT